MHANYANRFLNQNNIIMYYTIQMMSVLNLSDIMNRGSPLFASIYVYNAYWGWCVHGVPKVLDTDD